MRVLTDDRDLEELSSDAGMLRLRPRAAWAAESEQDVVDALARAEALGETITPRGGGTAIPSQSVGRGVVLLQDRRRAVISDDGTVACQPGLVKADLNDLLGSSGRWMPVDPSSYRSCTVGGMTSNNSSGIRTAKYGSTIDHVTGLRFVTPGSQVIEVGAVPVQTALSSDPRTRKVAELLLDNERSIREERPPVTKNSSGYRLERVLHDGLFDMRKLFVGSEGTLGVVTEVSFRTSARPESRLLLVVEAELGELGQTVSEFRRLGPSAVELVDKTVFRQVGRERMVAPYSRGTGDYLVFSEFDGSSGQVQEKAEEVASSPVAKYEPLALTGAAEVARAWEVRNETLNVAQEMKNGAEVLVPGVEDLVVPPDRLADLVSLLRTQFEKRGLTYISYGHAADANLHARPLLDPGSPRDRRLLEELMEDCFEAVWRMKGSMTGEHGDGMLRARFVERQYPKTYHVMKEVKRLFDPKGMLNPGVKVA